MATVEAVEQRFEGTWGREVSRAGQFVLRSPGRQSRTIVALLHHLRAQGCDFVPEPVGPGFAPDGRERFRYIEGETTRGVDWSDDALVRIGSMLRQAHDASTSFEPDHEPAWPDSFLARLAAERLVVVHGDLGPWNILALDGVPVAFIDWDTAVPAGHIWDLANVVWLNAQLHDDDVADIQSLPALAERARRARLMLDGYELTGDERVGFVDLMIEFAVRSAREEAIEREVAPTTPSPAEDGFPTLWALTWRVRAAAWMYDHRDELSRAIER